MYVCMYACIINKIGGIRDMGYGIWDMGYGIRDTGYPEVWSHVGMYCTVLQYD